VTAVQTATLDAGSDQAQDVLGLILEQMRHNPLQPAAKDPAREVTYGELRDEVATLAAGLSARGVCAGDRVAIIMPHSIDTLVASLACLWVGAMFVPFPPADPAPRIAALVRDCDPALILTTEVTAELTPPDAPTARIADLMSADCAGRDRSAPISPTHLAAYMMYTSGTTGTPKGVVIGRAAFSAAVRSCADALGLDATTRSLCVSPFHFDGSFATLFPTLVAGGSLVLPNPEAIVFARVFFRMLARENITYTGCSPTYLRLLLASPLASSFSDTPLRAIGLGGEASSAHDVAKLREIAPDLHMFNRYGPTETTIVVTHFDATAAPHDYRGGGLPIGVPHPGVTFYLVDEGGVVIEGRGRPGELYIGGVQLMDGYWGAPQLTADVLRTDIVAGETLYRTRDLVVRDDDGNYVYMDRLDRVVIRNANRISLLELAETVRGITGISAATCATYTDDDDRLAIAAFVVASGQMTATDVHLAAIALLPERMMPNTFRLVDELPRTSANKVDERRLLADAGLSRA
jgi:D-alanine--poly(phosphoribitol) ligase subunit 1